MPIHEPHIVLLIELRCWIGVCSHGVRSTAKNVHPEEGASKKCLNPREVIWCCRQESSDDI